MKSNKLYCLLICFFAITSCNEDSVLERKNVNLKFEKEIIELKMYDTVNITVSCNPEPIRRSACIWTSSDSSIVEILRSEDLNATLYLKKKGIAYIQVETSTPEFSHPNHRGKGAGRADRLEGTVRKFYANTKLIVK